MSDERDVDRSERLRADRDRDPCPGCGWPLTDEETLREVERKEDELAVLRKVAEGMRFILSEAECGLRDPEGRGLRSDPVGCLYSVRKTAREALDRLAKAKTEGA